MPVVRGAAPAGHDDSHGRRRGLPRCTRPPDRAPGRPPARRERSSCGPTSGRRSTGRPTGSTASPRGNDAHRALDRRGGRARAARLVRRDARALRPGRRVARRAGRRAGRPRDADARQPGRAVGVDARGDEDRRGHPADDHRARRARPRRPRRARASSSTSSRTSRTPGSSRSSTGVLPHRRRRTGRRLGRLRATPPPGPASSPVVVACARTTRASSTSPPARRTGRRWSCTRGPRTRSGTSRRCTGSGSGPATCTSRSARPAGRSTRGAASSRRGSRRRRSSSRTTRGSTRWRCARSSTEAGVTTFCAPPTVWRMLIRADLGARPRALREALSAGEPLNPEVIEQVRAAWGLTIRDGYGQTETTATIANTPGSPVKSGSMGVPLPGVAITLVDPISGEPADEGEICLDLAAAGAVPDGGLPRHRRAPVRPRPTATTARATSPSETRTASSPSSAAPTTSSSPRTTRCRRSRSRACSSSIPP